MKGEQHIFKKRLTNDELNYLRGAWWWLPSNSKHPTNPIEPRRDLRQEFSPESFIRRVEEMQTEINELRAIIETLLAGK